MNKWAFPQAIPTNDSPIDTTYRSPALTGSLRTAPIEL